MANARSLPPICHQQSPFVRSESSLPVEERRTPSVFESEVKSAVGFGGDRLEQPPNQTMKTVDPLGGVRNAHFRQRPTITNE
jgi:hypothetical protein